MTTIRMADGPPSASAYRAGACNIGPAEIRRRRDAGILGVAATVVLAAALVAMAAPAWARLLVFFPAAGAAIGFLQARMRFCVSFAVSGLRNFGPLGTPDKVMDAADHRADLVSAGRLVAWAILVGATVALLFALLPV